MDGINYYKVVSNCRMHRALGNEAQTNHSRPQNKAIEDKDKRMEIKPNHKDGED